MTLPATRIGRDGKARPTTYNKKDKGATPSQLSEFRGGIYEHLKKAVPNPDGIGGKSNKIVSSQNGNQQKTCEVLADKFGVSKNTILRDAELYREAQAGGGITGRKSKVNGLI